MTWNSTLKRTAPLKAKAPMARAKTERREGLGRKVETVMGFYRPPGHKLPHCCAVNSTAGMWLPWTVLAADAQDRVKQRTRIPPKAWG